MFEKIDSEGYSVSKHIFGDEPSGPEVLVMLLNNYAELVYSKPVQTAVPAASKANPKRALRAVRQGKSKGPALSKAQDALRISIW